MSIKLFDSHCHLQDDDFAVDREEVYRRAAREGVGLIIPGYTMASSAAGVEFSQAHDGTWALVGIHPHESKDAPPNYQNQLDGWVTSEPSVIGVGEIGLDYHYQWSPPDIQKKVFVEQMALAQRLHVPVSVHTREAEEDTWAIIREVGHPSGVIHCFTASERFAERVLDFGWFLSFSGVITFKNAHALRAIVSSAPLDRILIETDSPYLSPVPWRGQRNEPLRVFRVAEVVAAQKNISTKEVFNHTMSNTRNLFFAHDSNVT